MLRLAHEAKVPNRPELVYYVAAVQWPDGDSRQAHFVFDELKFAEQTRQQGANAPSREFIVLQMMSQMIEQIFTARRDARRGPRIIKPL